MNGTVLQYHLRVKTIPQSVIITRLGLDRTTLGKWKLGILFPHRLNAQLLIELFAEYEVRLDFNDIYRMQTLGKSI